MKVHYVDNEDVGLLSMTAIFKSSPSLSITTSKSVSGLLGRLATDRIDCVLLSVNSVNLETLEEDIMAVAESAKLPIVLMTDIDAADIRLRAALAGAEGLIEKSAMSNGVLEQVLLNARANFVARAAIGRESQNFPEMPGDEIPEDTPSNWFSIVQSQLDTLALSLNPDENAQQIQMIYAAREVASASKMGVTHVPSVSAGVPIRWALNAALERSQGNWVLGNSQFTIGISSDFGF